MSQSHAESVCGRRPRPSVMENHDSLINSLSLSLFHDHIKQRTTHTHGRVYYYSTYKKIKSSHEEDGLVFATVAQLSWRGIEMAECVILLLDCVVLLGGRWRGVCGSGRVGLEMDRDRCKFSKNRAP